MTGLRITSPRRRRAVTALTAVVLGSAVAAGWASSAGAVTGPLTYYACMGAATLTHVGTTPPACSSRSTVPRAPPEPRARSGPQGPQGATRAQGPSGLSHGYFQDGEAGLDLGGLQPTGDATGAELLGRLLRGRRPGAQGGVAKSTVRIASAAHRHGARRGSR